MTTDMSIHRMSLEQVHILASELAGRFADLRLLAENLQRAEIGKPATILNTLTKLANETNSTLLWYKRTVRWHGFQDVLEELGAVRWNYIESDPIDAEVMAKATCPVCGSADRRCETISYTSRSRDQANHSQAIASCNECHHCEVI